MVSYDRFRVVFEKFKFWWVTAGWRQGAPENYFFSDHVRNNNLGKVTKFGYHTITGVDMPEPNIVLWVLLTPSMSTVKDRLKEEGSSF